MSETFENVCMECGKPFTTDDVNAEICMDCWEKLISENFENEGKGQDID